jgi:hypothetical protein
MHKSPKRARLLTTLAVALQGSACGVVHSGTANLPDAGRSSSDGGSAGSETDGRGLTGGSGGSPGGSAATGGGGASEGGSQGLGGGGGQPGIAGAGAAGGVDAAGGAAGGAAGVGNGGAGAEPARIVLFDGSTDFHYGRWSSVRNGNANPWKYNDDGTMTVVGNAGDIQSTQTFRNVFVHVEYMTPKVPYVGGGQGRGNSGVLLNGSYELQILSLEAFSEPEPMEATCGAVFGLTAPLEIACHAEGLWNTYEIEFRAPLCDSPNHVVSPARFVEAKLNGRLIHRDVDVLQKTTGAQRETCEPRGLVLQDWTSTLPVSFRNIWAIPRD